MHSEAVRRGIFFATFTLLLSIFAIVALFLLALVLPIGKPTAHDTVTINVESPSKAAIALPAFLNVTTDEVDYPHSLHPEKDNVFYHREMEELVMLYFNYGADRESYYLELIREKFAALFGAERYKTTFFYRFEDLSMENGKGLPPADNRKELLVRGEVAGPCDAGKTCGNLKKVGLRMHEEKKPSEYTGPFDIEVEGKEE